MAYTFDWHTPDRLAVIRIGETLTLEESQAQNDFMLPILAAATQPIHLIIDLTLTHNFPVRLNDKVLASTEYLRHPMLGWVMLINQGANPLLHMVVGVAGKTMGAKLRFVKSFDEALVSLHKLDLTLEPV